jgi:hypothetical protein
MFACLNTHAPLEFHSLIALDYAADGPEFLSKKKHLFDNFPEAQQRFIKDV